jgi:NMD protein affecting ribosome stability and mRNA decay
MDLEDVRNHLAMVLATNAYINICKSTDLVVAIDAIDKQIAKEPAEKTIRNVKYPLCPKCGRVLWGKEYYCATCGQRVNRGEQE